MIHERFYDQLLFQIEAGNARDSVMQLAGMLDAASLDPETFRSARTSLAKHRLASALTDGKATNTLPINQALRERAAHAGRSVSRAWREGQKLCIVGLSRLPDYAGLAGRDLSNVIAVETHAEDVRNLRSACGDSLSVVREDPASFFQHEHDYDLICAMDRADGCVDAALQVLIGGMAAGLAPGGHLLMSALVPHHLGTGWRQACLNWDVFCHTSEALVQGGKTAGLSTWTYADTSGCFVWADFCREDAR